MIGEQLKQIRKDRKWTQQQLADLAGVSLPVIGMVENNTVNTTVGTLTKIANALEVELLITIK